MSLWAKVQVAPDPSSHQNRTAGRGIPGASSFGLL